VPFDEQTEGVTIASPHQCDCRSVGHFHLSLRLDFDFAVMPGPQNF
jgi:hypothetical protein